MIVAPESFGGIQTSVSAVHLMLDGAEIISLTTVGPIVQESRRMFEKGEWRKSSLNFDRAVATFEQSVAQWRQKINEAIAVAKRQAITPMADRKKGRGGSIAEIAKLNAEKSKVEAQVAAAAKLMRRLQIDLQAETAAQESLTLQQCDEERPKEGDLSATSEETAEDAGDRELGRRGLSKEVELQVTVSEGVVTFTPTFPYGRLILFADSGEITFVCRTRVRGVVHIQDPDNPTEDTTIPLRELVERVRAGGVWLLQSREPSSQMANDESRLE